MKAKIGHNHALKDIVKISRYLPVSRYFLMFTNDAIYCFRDISRYKTLNPGHDLSLLLLCEFLFPIWLWWAWPIHGLGTLFWTLFKFLSFRGNISKSCKDMTNDFVEIGYYSGWPGVSIISTISRLSICLPK